MNSIVIATYNEADSIRAVLDGLTGYPVVVVDDDSPDGTGAIAASYPNVTLLRRPCRMGLASAYLTGFREALLVGSICIIQMDAGLSHDPRDVPRLLDSRYALTIGTRFLIKYPFRGWRTGLSLSAAWIMRRLGVDVTDATSGFRCWDAHLLSHVMEQPITAQGHAFQLETLYWAWRISDGNVGEMSIEYKLTNTSLQPWSLWEALRVYGWLGWHYTLWRD